MLAGGPCALHDAPRAYVASPIFSSEQLERVGEVVRAVETSGYVSYSPARDGVMLKPTDPPERRDEVFHSNRLAIHQSDLLVAILDVKDTGTIWELGMATGRALPIIAVTLDVPQMNVMLERGVVAHVRSIIQLQDVLLHLRPHLCFGRKSTNELREAETRLRAALKAAYSYSGQTQ